MKDELMDLVHELTSSAQPHNLEQLTFVFHSYRELFQPLVVPPKPCASLWHALRNIRSQVIDWQQLVNEQNIEMALREEIHRLEQEQINRKKRAEFLKAKLEEYQVHLNECYPALLRAYNSYLVAKEPTIALSTPTTLSQQQNLLLAYFELLNHQHRTLTHENISLQLAEAFIKRKEISGRLKSMAVITSDDSFDSIKLFKIGHNKLASLNQLKMDLEQIQQELAENISLQEIKEDIEHKKQQIKTINAELLSLELQLKECQLPEDERHRLNSEYAKAPHKEQFIAEKTQELSWQNSVINPLSWFEWSTNSNFMQKVHSQQLENHYLNLLHQEHELTTQANHLREQLLRSQDFMIAGDSTFKIEPASKVLRARAIKLLAELEPQYSLKADNNLLLLSDLIERIGFISKQTDNLETVLRLLEELITIDKTVLELRTKYTLIGDMDELMPSTTELAQLRESAEARQQEISVLTEKIQSCEQCLQKIASINEINLELKDGKKQASTLRSTLRAKRSELAKTVAYSQNHLKIEQAKQVIVQQINELQDCLQTFTLKANETLADSESSSSFTKTVIYQDNLHFWNRLISNLSSTLPSDLQHWYQHLIISLQANIRDELRYHQALHVLQDLFFEIQNPDQDFLVLRAYQKLCPVPKQDWQRLVNLKPMFSSDDQTLAELRTPSLNSKLRALYEQQKKLFKKHPREGELLKQLLKHIHQVAILAENDNNHPALQHFHFMSDPRYQCLQRHRGFYRICEWLGQLCATIISLFKNESPVDYRQFFFFKSTRTERLIEEMNQEIIHCAT
ncbi:hypothetical protein [Legionella jordanis]|uniref:Interaptin n=1 Tax=Legionella jordanis TaxID=456 RepID=A0A0W0VDB7_9GAMM|nr:hypothetical protein [Legionella jordanis]KTD18123.1 interaptin [Legionella jordanis]RMX00567.1 hypothetical protein EAW55_12455 [Legionella jordanis]RMX21316.1 hypothetical protein EAS68_03870 [Legionella jordanis]VEH13784.1 interaptin [Legionella jordanis]